MAGNLAMDTVAIALSAWLCLPAFAQSLAVPDAAARQWLLYVDGGDYAKGWERAGKPFKAQITVSGLQSKIAPVREPLGAVMERRSFKVIYSNSAPGLPDGKYAAAQFSSRFANKDRAGETVWLELEGDNWAVIGYFIGPDMSQATVTPAAEAAPGTRNCTPQEMAQARIARMNGYTDGPVCNLPE